MADLKALGKVKRVARKLGVTAVPIDMNKGPAVREV